MTELEQWAESAARELRGIVEEIARSDGHDRGASSCAPSSRSTTPSAPAARPGAPASRVTPTETTLSRWPFYRRTEHADHRAA